VGPFLYVLFEDSAYLAEANDGHKRVLKAIKSGDAKEVRESVIADIVSAANSLTPRLNQLLDERAKPAAASRSQTRRHRR
jgi:hypothetical protein